MKYNVLNKNQGGSIGGIKVKGIKALTYNRADIEKLSKNFKTGGQFKKSYPKEYKYASKQGWLREFNWLIIRQPISKNKKNLVKNKRIEWDEQTAILEAKKYSSRTELYEKRRSLFKFLSNNNLLDKAILIKNDVNLIKSRVLDFAKTCKFYKDFRENSANYLFAQKHGLINQVKQLIKENQKIT